MHTDFSQQECIERLKQSVQKETLLVNLQLLGNGRTPFLGKARGNRFRVHMFQMSWRRDHQEWEEMWAIPVGAPVFSGRFVPDPERGGTIIDGGFYLVNPYAVEAVLLVLATVALGTLGQDGPAGLPRNLTILCGAAAVLFLLGWRWSRIKRGANHRCTTRAPIVEFLRNTFEATQVHGIANSTDDNE